MTSPLKKLAGQTAVYGLSSIVGRLLNYLLVPMYTRIFLPSEYGVVTELMAYVGFLLILLTYGMETGFFRFSEKEEYNSPEVYSTTLSSLLVTSLAFAVGISIFTPSIASWIGYSNTENYIRWLGLTVALDAFSAIPFGLLRKQQRAARFAFVKLVNIGLNIGLNLFFLLLCPWLIAQNPDSWAHVFYNPEVAVGYIFISYLIASALTIVLLIPEIIGAFKNYSFNKKLWVKMIVYSLPLLVTGMAGLINDMLGRILIKFWTTVPDGIADVNTYVMAQVGIYGANIKIAVFMNIFIQAFRYAAEPFFFSYAKASDSRKIYADVMKYFVLLGLLIFLGIMLYIDLAKYFIGVDYYEGLSTVPYLLLAYLFLGVMTNLSIWYKLTDQTGYGMYISLVGAAITVGLNYVLIPLYGYMGAAYTALASYGAMAILSYIWGQKHYPIPYEISRIFGYTALALTIYAVSMWYIPSSLPVRFMLNSIGLLVFVAVIVKYENVMRLFRKKSV